MSPRLSLVDEGVRVEIDPAEAAFLEDLLRVLAATTDPDQDPGAARLTLPVYREDPEADDEWRRLAGAELDAARRADRSSFELVLEAAAEGPTVMSRAEAAAFMRVVNDVRLVLGARWGIEGPDDYDALRPEANHALGYLGWLVAELAELLSGEFPSDPDG